MSESNPPDDRQRRVEQLADEYLDALLAGKAPDRQALLATHADLADLLEPRLALVDLMHRVAKAGPTRETARHIKCPHCGNGIQVVDTAPDEVTCDSCGSSFHIDPQSTAIYHAADLPRTVGKFEVLERLGRGAFGTVYKARDPDLHRLVAVKVPRAGSFATAEEEERFLREARAAAQLSHPGIVPVLEIAHANGMPYIVSEFVEGLTLADVLTARRPGFRESAELVAAAADALDFAHRRLIVHRDVKPSNLLLDAAGRPHIADFGLARRGEGEAEITVTLDGQVLGTPAYMAPEQAAGDQQRVDARSDVYSLGVVLYELLTGELPFRGNQRMLLHQVIHDEPRPPRSLNDRVPRDLETICLKAMAKSPPRRYASAQELADDLRRYLNNEPIRARPVGRTEKLARWARRNPTVAGLTTVVALLLLAVATGGIGFALYEQQVSSKLSNLLDESERNKRAAELRAAGAAVDLDLKYCEDGEIEYGLLRLARTLQTLPPHAVELRQCVEMNLFAWAQEIRPLIPQPHHEGNQFTVALSPDGRTVLTGGGDGTVRLWDALSGKMRSMLDGHKSLGRYSAFSGEGKVAITFANDGTVCLWDVATSKRLVGINTHLTDVPGAALSPDGRRLLTWGPITTTTYPTGRPDGFANLLLWDAETGRLLNGNRKALNGASWAFSGDGRILATWTVSDTEVALWSAANCTVVGTIHLPERLNLLGFGTDPNVLITVESAPGGPKTVRWWDSVRLTQIGIPCSSDKRSSSSSYLIDRDFALGYTDTAETQAIFLNGNEKAIATECSSSYERANDRYFLDNRGGVYDRVTGKRRAPPRNHEYASEAADFAVDGRFMQLAPRLIDLSTEKHIGRGRRSNDVNQHRPVIVKKRSPVEQQGPLFVAAKRSFVSTCVYSEPDSDPYLLSRSGIVRIVPVLPKPLEAPAAELFSEVVTCQRLNEHGSAEPLDEATWEQRRNQLAELVTKGDATGLVAHAAADKWYWLRRRIDKALAEQQFEEAHRQMDRLIAVEHSWQNYLRRATMPSLKPRDLEVARDFLEAGRLAGGGFWHQRRPIDTAWALLWEAKGTPAGSELGLRLVEAISRAHPDTLESKLLLALAYYRVGQHGKVLSTLEFWQRQKAVIFASRVGLASAAPWPGAVAPLNMDTFDDEDFGPSATALLAMTYHKSGHRDKARAMLESAQTQIKGWEGGRGGGGGTVDRSPELVKEAKSLIEGPPAPGK